MESELEEILSLVSLKIGYTSGSHENLLLPPLNAHAVGGELIAVIGRNGIGKSTLLRTLTGLQPSLGGEIFYSGKNISDYSRIDLARKVGYISTEQVKVSNMSVYDLVALGRFPHTSWTGKIDISNHEVIIDAIVKTGMYNLRSRYIYELSDGERQRAMIARILAQDTDIMIMDEPTAFLDIGNKYEILHLMHQLSQESGKTIIFSTHDLQMAITRSDKIWLILNNSLVEGAPEDLLIDGSFDHLFDASPVRFNAGNGTFSFRSEGKGTIYLQGGGKFRHWTEMAVNRAGYMVSEAQTNPFIIVPDSSNRHWILKSKDIERRFDSLYELVKGLNRETN
jgi:iron complex transport system ATP-binding protein